MEIKLTDLKKIMILVKFARENAVDTKTMESARLIHNLLKKLDKKL